MKNKVYLYLSFKNLMRNKNITYKNIFILTSTLILFIMTTSIGNSLNKFIKNTILSSPEYKSIMVLENENKNKDKILNILKNNKNIVEFSEYETPLSGDIKAPLNLFDTSKKNSMLLKSSFKSSMPNIINGSLFDDNDKNVGIIPKYFDSTNQIGINIEKEKFNFLDGNDFLGKNITLEFKDPDDENKVLFEYSFKVVGVYDGAKNMSYPNDIYIPNNDLKFLRDKYNKTYDKDLANSPLTYIALVDNYDNISSVLKEFHINDIDAFKKSEVGFLLPLSKIILYFGGFISIVIFFVSLTTITLNNINALRKRQGEIAMLKSFGYTNSHIKNIVSLELFIVNILGFVLSMVFSSVVLMILNMFIKSKLSIYFNSLYFNIDALYILGGLILIFICTLISSLRSIKYITKINPIIALKNKY